MSIKRYSRKVIAGLAVATTVTLSAGVAFAYWTTGGTGTGSAGVGTVQAVTVNQSDTAPSGLYPGGAAQNVGFTIHNADSGKDYVTTITMAIKTNTGGVWSVAGTGGKPDCTAADFTLTQPTWTAAEVNSGDTAVAAATSGASIALKDLGTNQDACKGATVPLYFTAS